LNSGDPAVTVPGSVTIAATKTSQTFTATTTGVAMTDMVTVTATVGASNMGGILAVNPATIKTVTFSPSSVTGGVGSVGTVTLNGPAPAAGLTVTLMSNNTTVAAVPASFNIAGGATSGDFNVTTLAVAATAIVSITATLPSGTAAGAGLTVIPPVVTMLSFDPAILVSGEVSTVAVLLSGNAPAGGLTVGLSSSNSSAFPVPANVVVSAGSNSQTFMVTAGAVAASTPVTVAATTGSTMVMGNATVVPVVAGISVVSSPSSLTFGPLPAGTAAGAQAVSVTNNG